MVTRRALAEAVDALETKAGEVVVSSLRGVLNKVVRSLDRDAWPVTASAEDELSRLLDEWGIAVDAKVLPMFHEVYGTGGMAAVGRMHELGYDIFDSDVIALYMDEGARDHLLQSRNRFLQVGQRAWELARQTMAAGFEAGDGVDKIARDLRRVIDLSSARAMMVARTEVISAANAGATRRIDLAAAAGENVPPYKQWLCVSAETTVWSPQPRQVVKRRRPAGPLVRVETRTGHVLTVTPNHPVLTDRGWRRAGLLDTDDHLIRHAGQEPGGHQLPGASGRGRPVFGEYPYVDDGPPRVDELHRASTQRWPHRRMMTTVVDLDCDGVDCEVEVVPTDGYLGAHVETAGAEPAGERTFVLSDVSLAVLFADGSLGERLGRHGPATVGVSRGGRTPGNDFGAVTLGSHDPGGAAIATLNPTVVEPASDRRMGYVPGAGEYADAVAGQVTLDEVVEVRWLRESGWHDVYDLTTGCGWFVANGFIVHNSTLDNRTRPTHVGADGQVVERGQPFIVGGAAGMYPGDPSLPAAEVISCRCTVLFVDTPEGERDVEGRGEGGVVEAVEGELSASSAIRSGEHYGEAVMPYGIRSGGSGCPHQVYNSETDEAVPGGCHGTRSEALDHQRALMAQEEAASLGSEVLVAVSTELVERAAGFDEAGGKPNPGTPPDERLKENKPKAKAKNKPPPRMDSDDGELMEHAAEMEPQPGEHFHAVMHTEGKSTGMRTFTDLDWRDPPFAYHWQKSSSAHGGQPETVSVGLVSRVERDHYDESIIHGWGHLDLGSENGREYGRRLVDEYERWVSIGLDETPYEMTVEWPESEDGEEGDGLLALLLGGQPEQVNIKGGRIGELTGVSVPAQDDAVIEATDELRAALAEMARDDENADAIEVPADGTLHEMTVEWRGSGTGGAPPEVDGHFAAVGDAADVDWSDWDAGAALGACNDAACYRAICAGRRAGDPSLRASWALPHHKNPDAAPNANGVRAALGRFDQTQGLTNTAQARSHLERHQSTISAARERKANAEIIRKMGAATADVVEALTASAYRIEVPELPPAWWFDAPTDLEIPGAFCVTDEGRIYGILAPLRTGHRAGSRDGGRTRIEAPRGNVDYSRFLSKEALTQDGRLAGVGAITMDCGHASRFRASHDVAPEHYDNACSIIGKIRVGETVGSDGRGVVWAAGALEPGVTPSQMSRMLACALSGDWQPHPDRPGWSELVAALLVPSEGFPYRRTGPTVTTKDGVLVASSVPVYHREPSYISSVDRDPVVALGLNDIAADAVRRSYLQRITAEPDEPDDSGDAHAPGRHSQKSHGGGGGGGGGEDGGGGGGGGGGSGGGTGGGGAKKASGPTFKKGYEPGGAKVKDRERDNQRDWRESGGVKGLGKAHRRDYDKLNPSQKKTYEQQRDRGQDHIPSIEMAKGKRAGSPGIGKADVAMAVEGAAL